MKIDLHIHTSYSDGAFSPKKIVDCAKDAELGAIAISDHDNVLSWGEASEYAKENGIELIPGVEINTLYKGYEVHILGYFMDINNSDFQKLIKTQQQARIRQAKEISSLLKKRAGINVSFEDIKSLVAEGGSIGRPHIARAIASANGVNLSIIDAYAKYINDDSNVYVQRKTVSPHDAVEVISEAGGIPVFAHPYDVDIADALTKELMNFGLRGLEAYHRKHSPAIIEYFSTLAEKYGLIVTGGSDFHAPNPINGNIIIGKNFVPEWVYDELIKEKKRVELSK